MKFPWYFTALYVLLGGLVLARVLGLDGHNPRLDVRDRGDRIVVRWTGGIEAPMSEELGRAFAGLRDGSQPVELVIGSLGGSVAEGARVIELVRAMQRTRPVTTHVASHCGSMCVPIFLVGTQRTAAPKANFMFHEVRFRTSERDRSDPSDGPAKTTDLERRRIALATDQLFQAYMTAPRVDRGWLARMRQSIPGTDVWLTAQELVDQQSGVIDALVP